MIKVALTNDQPLLPGGVKYVPANHDFGAVIVAYAATLYLLAGLSKNLINMKRWIINTAGSSSLKSLTSRRWSRTIAINLIEILKRPTLVQPSTLLPITNGCYQIR